MTPSSPPAKVVRLDRFLDADTTGDGVHWSLEGGGELNVNLVHLDPGSSVADHVNRDVDVVVIALAGTGRVSLDKVDHTLVPHALVLAAKGVERSIVAGPDGLTYLTVHRSRGLLGITPNASPRA